MALHTSFRLLKRQQERHCRNGTHIFPSPQKTLALFAVSLAPPVICLANQAGVVVQLILSTSPPASRANSARRRLPSSVPGRFPKPSSPSPTAQTSTYTSPKIFRAPAVAYHSIQRDIPPHIRQPRTKPSSNFGNGVKAGNSPS